MSDLRNKRRNEKKKRQLKLAILTAAAIVLVIILILLIINLMPEKNSADNSDASADVSVISDGKTAGGSTASASDSKSGTSSVSGAESDAAAVESTSSVSAAPSSKNDTITLSENQKYTGDLILVNSDHAYNFEANADIIDLVTILNAQSFGYPVSKSDFQVSEHIMQPLDALISACNKALGTSVTGIESAYRTKDYQQEVWDEAESTYGKDYAKKYVATPGYSEHHTGLAVDFGIITDTGLEKSFSESDNAMWMEAHSYEYGFIRRFAEDKASITKVNNEAWHFRYVGIPHAAYMTKNNLCLEEYIDFLRNSTSDQTPLTIETSDGTYHVYFTSESVISKPAGEYDISGNNVDGWIITERVS